jgi:hypothetical protein
MTVIYPSEEISHRWHAARQLRLRRAPLERILRANGVAPAPTGPSESGDNLVRVTLLIVESGLLQYRRAHVQPFHEVRHAAVGHVACVVSRALAAGISEPAAWRVAALLSAAQLLRPHIGFNAAALASASLVRCYELGLSRPMRSLDGEITDSVFVVLNNNSAAASAQTAALVATSVALDDAEDPQRELPLETKARR